MPGQWHDYIQTLFPLEWREIYSPDKSRRADVLNKEKKIVVEVQHSFCKDVKKRTSDWSTFGYSVVWIFDGRKSENTNCLDLCNCQHIIANTRETPDLVVYIYVDDKHIYPIQTKLFKNYTAKVQSITLLEFVTNVKDGTITEIIPQIEQSIITIRQDPPGSGKTYSMTYDAVNDTKYDTTLMLCQEHAPLHVISDNIKFHTGWEEQKCKKAYIYKRDNRIIIIATIDSMMHNLSKGISDTHTRCTFSGMAETINKSGPITSDTGYTQFKGECIRFCCKTKIIVDEATKTNSECYLDALDRIVKDTGADMHICGDKLQSTKRSENLMQSCANYYKDRDDVSLFVTEGNEIRRFGKSGIDLLNEVIPYEQLGIKRPVAHRDAPKDTDIFCHSLGSDTSNIITLLENDIIELMIEPKEVLIICIPTYKSMFDNLHTAIDNLWSKLKYTGKSFFSYLHTSQDGEPIDLSMSEDITRMVSIHSSQGDGRKLVYVVGLSDKHIRKYVRDEKHFDLKYWSLVNVCLSRMKRRMRIFVPEIDELTIKFKKLISDADTNELIKNSNFESPRLKTDKIVDYAEISYIQQVRDSITVSKIDNPNPKDPTEWSDHVLVWMIAYFRMMQVLMENERFYDIMKAKFKRKISNNADDSESNIYIPYFNNQDRVYNEIERRVHKIKTTFKFDPLSIKDIAVATYMMFKTDACKAFKLYEIFSTAYQRDVLINMITYVNNNIETHFIPFYEGIAARETILFANILHTFRLNSDDKFNISSTIPILVITDKCTHCIYLINNSISIEPIHIRCCVDNIVLKNCEREGTKIPAEFDLKNTPIKQYAYSISSGTIQAIAEQNNQLGVNLMISSVIEKYSYLIEILFIMYESNYKELNKQTEELCEIWLKNTIAAAIEAKDDDDTWTKTRFINKCKIKLDKCFKELGYEIC